MAQNAAPILFVSMDGKGVKSSAIRAHAARRGHQKSRQNMAKPAPDTAATQPKNKIATSDSTSKAKARRKVNLRATQDQSISEAQKEVPKDDSKELRQENQIVSAKRETPSPLQSFLSSGKSEHYVQMFFEIINPSYTAAYDAFNVPNIIMQQWPLFMHHEVFFWTEAAAIQGLQDSLRYPDKPPSKQVLLYKANALTCLKRELMNIQNGQLDDYLVMSIFVLASLDLMAGDEIAHDAHKKILRTAFAAAGGLHNYGTFVRNTTMRLDSFWRSTVSEPTTPAVPLLQPSRIPQLPTHPFSPHLTDLVGKLPEGFKELALQLKLPLDVLEVLGRIADPAQKPLPSMPSSNDNRSPSSHCGMYVDFWESCPSLSSSYRDRNNEPPLERLLALALLIYSTNRDASNPLRMYNCIANGAIYDLCHDLPQCETRRSRHEENCLFWIWTVTVDAMRDRFGELTAQGDILLEQQKKRFPGVIGTSLEEQVLKRFWFSSEYSDGSCLFVPSPMYSRAQPKRGDTYTSARSGQSESASSPGASGSSSWGKSETMDNWSITTPRHERDETEFGVRSNSSQADETESVGGKWHGPGFGLLPSRKQLGDAPELSYGRIGTSRQGPVKCLAG